MSYYEYGYVVQTVVDEPTLRSQITTAGLPDPDSVTIGGFVPKITVDIGYDTPLSQPDQVTLSGVMDTYTVGLPDQWATNWHVEDPAQNGKVVSAKDYQDYDPGTGIFSNLVREYDYTWQGFRFISTTITEYAADGSVISVTTEPVYTTNAGGQVTPAGRKDA